MVGGDPRCCELLLYNRAQLGIADENGWQEIHQVSRFSPESWGELGYLDFEYPRGWNMKEIADFLTERRRKFTQRRKGGKSSRNIDKWKRLVA